MKFKINPDKLMSYLLSKDLSEYYDKSLIKEMADYSESFDKAIKVKARRIYIKCIKSGKIELAIRISNKYDLHSGGDDLIMAYALTLL